MTKITITVEGNDPVTIHVTGGPVQTASPAELTSVAGSQRDVPCSPPRSHEAISVPPRPAAAVVPTVRLPVVHDWRYHMTTANPHPHLKPAHKAIPSIALPMSPACLFGMIWQSRTIDSNEEETLFRVTSACPSAEAAVSEILELGLLSSFQMEEILAGRGNSLLLGSYVLLEPIGEGGMGKVYKARHRLLRENRALKVIRGEVVGCEASVQRFLREGRAGARLCHENIVRTIDLGREGDTLFLVTDYVAGTDLRRLVTTRGPLPWHEAASCARQAALGLQHAHEQGVVHRDVKPSNLILTADGTVKVLDLGLARLLLGEEGPPPTLLTPNGMVLGTPDFAAPEQLGGSPADTRSDVYSLGCTLHFLLAGEPPFPGGDVWSKVLRHHSSSAPALTELRPDVPAELAATVVRMMDKDPDRRYQTPGEAAAALGLFCR